MRRLLYIIASPRKERSRSAMVADHFLTRLKQRYPALVVERLDLFDADLPSFDQDAVASRYHIIADEAVDPAQTDAWRNLKK